MSVAPTVGANSAAFAFPLPLSHATLKDVALEGSRSEDSQEQIDLDSVKPILWDVTVNSISFDTLKAESIRALCSLWKIKRIRGKTKPQLRRLIAYSQQVSSSYGGIDPFAEEARAENFKARLLNDLFHQEFVDEFIQINWIQHKDKLDKG